MKKVNFSKVILFFLAFLAFSSCKKSNEPEGELEPPIDKIIKDYVNQSYDKQVEFMTKQLDMYNNQSFRLSAVITHNADGSKENEGVFNNDCAYYRKITILPKSATSIYSTYSVESVDAPSDLGCPVYASSSIIEFDKSDYSDYKVLMNFANTKNLDSFDSYKGVLQLMEASGAGLKLYEGIKDSNGKFKITKEYSYANFN